MPRNGIPCFAWLRRDFAFVLIILILSSLGFGQETVEYKERREKLCKERLLWVSRRARPSEA